MLTKIRFTDFTNNVGTKTYDDKMDADFEKNVINKNQVDKIVKIDI